MSRRCHWKTLSRRDAHRALEKTGYARKYIARGGYARWWIPSYWLGKVGTLTYGGMLDSQSASRQRTALENCRTAEEYISLYDSWCGGRI
jgi:hypothetical protein